MPPRDQNWLHVEHLEERILLSTVQIHAIGTEGDEAFNLKIDDQVVASWTLDGSGVYSYESADTITADQIKIEFVNDVFDPQSGQDRNLIVDRIVVDGKTFETEHPSTFSTGTWNPINNAAVPGNWQSEWLHSNGILRFANQGATTIEIVAQGATGEESMSLTIRGGQEIASWIVSTGPQVYTVQLDEVLVPSRDQIRVEFTNDVHDSSQGIDRNLIVDRIVVNGQVYESEASTTYSTGTWTPDDQLSPGYGRGEWLHANGYFQYASPPSLVTVRASGDEGFENFLLSIDGQEVRQIRVSAEFNTFSWQHDAPVTANDVRIIFNSDKYGPESGVDTNVNLDWMEVNGVRYEAESNFVFSTATWSPEDNQIRHGFGRGPHLHTNGYFQFHTGSTINIRAKGSTGLENFDLIVDGKKVGNYEVSQDYQVITFVADKEIRADQVRIEYNSDDDAGPGLDPNLTVDWIKVDGHRYETEASSTFSSGTGFVGPDLQFGFGHGETLFLNGFFQYHAVVMNDDPFSLPEDSVRVPLGVLVNDTSSEDYVFDIAEVTDAAHGTVELIDGQVYYTPNNEFVGTDSFTYHIQASTGSRQLFPATVEIDVRQSHQQPQTLINPDVAPELTPSGEFLMVEKLVKLPLDASGRQPRMNFMTTTGDRIFVVTDGLNNGEGNIYELVTDGTGQTSVELFLDVGAAVFANTGKNIVNSTPLNGLRSIAFHPEFDSNGKFYTAFTGERPDDPSQSVYLSLPDNPIEPESVLVEWTYDLSTGQVDTSSYREVFRVGMFVDDHPIRGMLFNPFAQPGDEDYGLLYIGHGDGSEQSAVSGDGQNNDALGKILRINPLEGQGTPFTIPDTNPFVGSNEFPDAVYSIGHRNPQSLTFAQDSSGQSHLIVTEIGRDNVDEINLIVPGGNYGWADREAIFVHDPDGFGINVNISNLPADEAQNGLTYPVAIFGHDGQPDDTFVGQAIAGGHVIKNGSALDGQFIFVEFATDGRAYHVDFAQMLQQNTSLDPNDPNNDSPDDLTWMTPQELTILFDHDNDDTTTPLVRNSLKDVLDDESDFEEVPSAGKLRADLRLGQGPNGELYVMNKRNGWIYRVTNSLPPAP